MAFDVQKFVQSGFDANMLSGGAAGLTEAAQAVVDNEELFGFAGNKAPVKAAQEALLRAGEAGKLQTAIDLFGDAQGYQDFITGVDKQLSAEGRLSIENRKQAIAEKVGFADVNALSLGEGQTFQSKLDDELARGTSFITGAAQPFAFSNFQSKFADAQSELASGLADAQASVANLLDIPAGTDPAVVAELESRAQTLLDENASDQEMANQLGIDVPTAQKLRGAFVSSAEVGEQQFAVGRSGRALKGKENPDGTWDIVDSNTGEVVESGFADATALRPRLTELQSASVPDEVGAFAEAVGVTDTPAGASLMDVVNATDGSLSSNKEFVNGAFQAFLGRDATQAELDQYTGQSVDAVRNALQAGATGTVTDADVSIDDSFVETFDSTFIDDALSDPVTDSDISSMLSDMQDQQQEILSTLQPTEAETEIKDQLADLRNEIESQLVSFSAGLNKIEDQPIAMEFITGQQASLERTAQTRLQNLARVEENLLTRLGLEQEARQVASQVAQTELGFLQTNLDTAFKVKSMLVEEEERIFNRSMALKADSRETLALILDSMSGLSEEDLSPDQLASLQSLSASADIPYSLLLEGMDHVKNSLLAENSGSFLENMTEIGGEFYYEDPITGDVKKFNPEELVLPSVQTTASSILGTGVVTGYGSNAFSEGLDFVLSGGLGADVSLPFTFQVDDVTNTCTPGDLSCNGGWGNQVKLTVKGGPLDGQQVQISHLDSVGVNPGSYLAGTSIGAQGNTGKVLDASGNGLSASQIASGRGTHLDIAMVNPDGGWFSPEDVARTFGVSSGEHAASAISSAATSGLSLLKVRLSSDAAKSAEAAITQALSSGDDNAVREAVLTSAIEALPGNEEQKSAIGRIQAVSAINAIDSLLQQYVATGGDTGLLSGNIERIQENVLKRTDDPELSNIANQITVAIQAYRKAVSGAAFTESEQKEYEAVFPNIRNTPELNAAKVDSLLSVFERNQRSALGTMMGVSNYDAVFGDTNESDGSYLDEVVNMISGDNIDQMLINLGIQ
jgi:hypothetical protein